MHRTGWRLFIVGRSFLKSRTRTQPEPQSVAVSTTGGGAGGLDHCQRHREKANHQRSDDSSDYYYRAGDYRGDLDPSHIDRLWAQAGNDVYMPSSVTKP